MIAPLLVLIMIAWYHEISLLLQACVILVVNLILQCQNMDTYSCKHHLSARFCVDCMSYLYLQMAQINQS